MIMWFKSMWAYIWHNAQFNLGLYIDLQDRIKLEWAFWIFDGFFTIYLYPSDWLWWVKYEAHSYGSYFYIDLQILFLKISFDVSFYDGVN